MDSKVAAVYAAAGCPNLEDTVNFYKDLKEKWTLPDVTMLHLGVTDHDEVKKIITFRTYLCELIYRAVQYFPDIVEYTIECKNNSGTVTIKLGEFKNETEVPDVAIVITQCGVCSLSKAAIVKMYSANRIRTPDHRQTNMLIDCIFNGGYEPSIKTSWVIKNYTDYNTITKY